MIPKRIKHLKIGDKVQLKYISNSLRYNVKLKDIGEIVDILEVLGAYPIVVKWFEHESAMTHTIDELKIISS
jgi:hypothetical protein